MLEFLVNYPVVFSILISMLVALLFAKYLFADKFKNKPFIMFSSLTVLSFVYFFCVVFFDLVKANESIELSKYQLLNHLLLLILNDIYILNILLLILAILAIVYCVFNFIKNKNLAILKKMMLSLIVFGVLFYLTYPSILIKKYDILHENCNVIEKAYKYSLLPIFKTKCALELEFCTYKEISEKYDYKTFSSFEAQKLISENLMWAYVLQKDLYVYRYGNLSMRALEWGKFDEALKYYNLAKSNGETVGALLVRIYIAKGEYQSALDELNSLIQKDNPFLFGLQRDDLYLMSVIYTGLNEFEKAHQKINEWYKYTKNNKRYHAYKFFIYKKSGENSLAQKYYDKLQKIDKYGLYKGMTIDELFLYLDRVYW